MASVATIAKDAKCCFVCALTNALRLQHTSKTKLQGDGASFETSQAATYCLFGLKESRPLIIFLFAAVGNCGKASRVMSCAKAASG